MRLFHACGRISFTISYIYLSIQNQTANISLRYLIIYECERSRTVRLVRLHASDLSVHSSRDIVSGPGGPSDVRALPGDERLFST